MRFAVKLAALCALVCVMAQATAARAEVRRYAFLVGANRGHAHETPLRHAESDVNAVADTLTSVGGYPSERVVRLLGAPADRVRAALVELGLTMQQDLRAGGEAVLFVYYSGHADAQALHLGGTDLPTAELTGLVRLSPAQLKVMLVDACRSGAITRSKGGRQVAPLQITARDELRQEGLAVIASSAAGEDAQESDELRASIFTHHFLTALRGPGDVNRDRLVTLGEAYSYAYEQTLKTSLLTSAGTQHATFKYDLSGRADPVLADLRAQGDRSSFVLAQAGEYLVVDRGSGVMLADAVARAPNTEIVLPPGDYQIRLRTKTNVYQGDVSLALGARTAVSTAELRPLPLAQVVRKGETEAHLAHGPVASAMIHGPLATGFSAMTGAQFGWALELPRVSLVPRIGLGRGTGERPGADVETHRLLELSAELAALYVMDVGGVSLAPLISVGWVSIWQNVDLGAGCVSALCSYTAHPQAFLTTIGGHAAIPLGRGFALETQVELASFFLRRQNDRTDSASSAARAGTLTYRLGVGVGYRY